MSSAINMSDTSTGDPAWKPDSRPRMVAVIDVGTTSIRMAIAELNDGGVRHLEALTQSVAIGKDTFATGRIGRPTIERAVRVLQAYRRKLTAFQIDFANDVRVFGTSAVREAENRLQFVDRVFMATGLELQVLDEAEVQRGIYLGVLPYLKAEASTAEQATVVAEVGGGSTEVVVLRQREVIYSHAFRLGSLRLHQSLTAMNVPDSRMERMMKGLIARTLETLPDQLSMEQWPQDRRVSLIALGGDLRTATARLVPEWEGDQLAQVSVADLAAFTQSLIQMGVDDISRRFHLAYPEAESITPALLTYLELARILNVQTIGASQVNLRDGVLRDMASGGRWSEELEEQILRNVVNVGRKYDFDLEHARNVEKTVRALFSALSGPLRLEPRWELTLRSSALLHEIGQYIGLVGYHKHSMYLIANSDLFGVSHTNRHIMSLVTRYHRRAAPKTTHAPFMSLSRDDRVTVSKLAALLRLSVSLNASRQYRASELRCEIDRGRLIVEVSGVDDLSIEQLAIRQNGTMFEDVFGLRILLRARRS